jgi:hypothetical protein
MIRELINLATLNAFKMDPADVAYPLKERIPGRKLALLNWGPSIIRVGSATVASQGLEVAPEQLTFPATTPIPKIVEALAARTDCECVALLYSAVNLFCEAQNGPSLARETLETRLRTEPRAIVGPSFEEEKLYQVLLAPDGHTRIVFAISRAPYEELEKGLAVDGGLKIVRTQLGAYALLNAILADPAWKDVDSSPERIELPVIVNQAHVVVAGYDGTHFWPDVFRASPLFWERNFTSPEFAEEVRSFFLNCAESTILNRKVIGKQVLFRVLNADASEAAVDLGAILRDRSEVAFSSWGGDETHLDFKALLEG